MIGGVAIGKIITTDTLKTGTGGNMSWLLPPDTSGSAKTINVIGTSVSKVWVQNIPEPTTSLLVGLGLLGLAAARARKG